MSLKQWIRKNPDRAGACVVMLLGAIALLFGWNGVAGSAFPAEQLPYIISGGIGGALLVGVGATLLLSADLRDEWRILARIERKLAGSEALDGDADAPTGDEDPIVAPDPTPVEPPAASGSGEVVASSNGRPRRVLSKDAPST